MSLFPSGSDSSEKSLQIVLVRDVDGKTFWDALNDVISPRIKEPTATDTVAIETFRKTFQSRALKKGTTVLLTWAEPSKLLVGKVMNVEGYYKLFVRLNLPSCGLSSGFNII